MLYGALRWFLIAGLLAACGDATQDGQLLSSSRLSLAERETARVHVAVDHIDDFEIVAPPEMTIVPVDDAFGPGFDVTPTCAAAAGADANVIVGVRDRITGRSESLVVAVTDDMSVACSASVAMWLEPCAGDSCLDPCGLVQAGPATLTLPRGDSARLCAHAEALDPARPLVKPSLLMIPATTAFETGASGDGTLSQIIRGAAWLVGPYRGLYTLKAGEILVDTSTMIDIGAPSDVGIEIGARGPRVDEFARAVTPITVHRFVTGSCTIQIESPDGDLVSVCNATNVKLYDASNTGVGPCSPLSCAADAHTPFTLAYVPEIDASQSVGVPLKVITDVTTETNAMFAVSSRGENLGACDGANGAQLACADIDSDGALDVVTNGTSATCIHRLANWRDTVTVANGPGATTPQRIFTIPTAMGPTIYGIDSSSTLSRLTQIGFAGWTWAAQWTDASLVANAVPIRSTSGLPPDYLVGIKPSGEIDFVSMAGTPSGTIALGTAGNYAIGVIDVGGGGGEDIVVVSAAAGIVPTSTDQTISVYQLSWSGVGRDTPPTMTLYAKGTVSDMPSGLTRTIARRVRPGADDDLVISFRDTLFAAAVAELSIIPGTPPMQLSQPVLFGSVRSVVAAPDGSVLYGSEAGSRQSRIENGALVRTSIDPVLELAPDPNYGSLITACYDQNAAMAGFAVQTDQTSFRAAEMDIVVDTP